MKVFDVVLRTKDPELQDFVDNVQILLNSGRYEFRVINEVPTWSANEGESVFYSSGTDRRLYCYINGQWCYVGYSSGGSAYGSYIINAEGDTAVFTEYTAAEKILRFYANNVYVMRITSTSVDVASGIPVVFDGTTESTYWKYNATSHYLEGYVEGILRMEL